MSAAELTLELKKALVRTYGDPEDEEDPYDTVVEYNRVMNYADSHSVGYVRTAEALDLPESRARRWLSDTTPRVLQAVQVAEERGWLPVDLESETFRGLNAFVAWTLTGGSINSARWTPDFVVDDDLDRQLVTTAASKANVELRFTHVDDDMEPTKYQPEAGGTALGRFLHVLGVPLGTKTGDDVRLPAYLQAAPQHCRQEFAWIYLHKRAVERGADREDRAIMERRPQEYREALAALLENVLGAEVRAGKRTISIPAEAVQAWRELPEPFSD